MVVMEKVSESQGGGGGAGGAGVDGGNTDGRDKVVHGLAQFI